MYIKYVKPTTIFTNVLLTVTYDINNIVIIIVKIIFVVTICTNQRCANLCKIFLSRSIQE